MNAGFLVALFLSPKNVSDKYLRNVFWILTDYTSIHDKHRNSKLKLYNKIIIIISEHEFPSIYFTLAIKTVTLQYAHNDLSGSIPI